MEQCRERSNVALVPFQPGGHMWVEFAVCSRLTPTVLLRVSSPNKNQHFRIRRPAWKPAKAGVASSLDIVIYLFLLYLLANLAQLIWLPDKVELPKHAKRTRPISSHHDRTSLVNYVGRITKFPCWTSSIKRGERSITKHRHWKPYIFVFISKRYQIYNFLITLVQSKLE